MKPRNKTILIHKMVGFIFQQYSMYPSENDVILVCKAAIKMFGNIKGGIVCICSENSTLFIHRIYLTKSVHIFISFRIFIYFSWDCTMRKIRKVLYTIALSTQKASQEQPQEYEHFGKFSSWIDRSRKSWRKKLFPNVSFTQRQRRVESKNGWIKGISTGNDSQFVWRI